MNTEKHNFADRQTDRQTDRDWTGNFRSVAGCLGDSNIAKLPRAGHDYYATHPIAAEWLVKLEDLDKNIWECACGEGHLSKVFVEKGFNVRSTDLVDRGYGKGGINFLMEDGTWQGDIVTNPPYKYAQEFVEHALDVVADGQKVCMFLKVQFLEGIKRRAMFDATPPKRIWVSSSRIRCGRNGEFDSEHSMIAYAWYVWEKGYQGDTILKWFN